MQRNDFFPLKGLSWTHPIPSHFRILGPETWYQCEGFNTLDSVSLSLWSTTNCVTTEKFISVGKEKKTGKVTQLGKC